MINRRDFLKGGAAALGAAAFLPSAIARAHAIAPAPGSTWKDAEHVVILMQENRSFDHLFGALRGVRGFNDPRVVKKPDGKSVFVQSGPDGKTAAPWHLSLKNTRITWMGDLPHGRTDQLDAWNGGHHDNWLSAKASSRYPDQPLTMGYHTREDAPFYYQLADAFTVCDQHYSSIMTSTAPNRLMMWSGTVREPHDTGDVYYLRNGNTHPGGLNWTSFPERLQEAGVSWQCYQNLLYCESPLEGEAENWLGNFGDNSLERLQGFPVHFSERFGEYVSDLIDDWIAVINQRIEEFEINAATAHGSEKEELERQIVSFRTHRDRVEERRAFGNQDLNSLGELARELRSRGLGINDGDPDYLTLQTIEAEIDGQVQQLQVPKGDVLHRFRKDVQEGKLPAVSWLVPGANFSDHPGRPWFGAWYLSEVLNILTENPDVWKKTIFILTYDENDGFFDHIPPFVAPDPRRPQTGAVSAGIDVSGEYSTVNDDLLLGTSPEQARGGPVGLGYRVPMVIASPWSRGGWVNSEVSDATSTIRFIEKFVEARFGVNLIEPNISGWRRTVCGDLTSCFHSFEPDLTTLDFVGIEDRVKFIHSLQNQPLPATESDLSKHTAIQESGVRLSCALPYDLGAACWMDPDAGELTLELTAGAERFGTQSAGGAFNAYLYNVKSGTEVYKVGSGESSMAVSSYAVVPGGRLRTGFRSDNMSTDQYELAVHGPNGFYRFNRGSTSGDPVRITLELEERRLGGWSDNPVMQLVNNLNEKVLVSVRDRSYGGSDRTVELPANSVRNVVIDVEESRQWYDIEVAVAGDSVFSRRLAGRWENGSHQTSDPLMGFVAAPASS